jgi:arylsulfatase A-like enzyme
MYHEQSSRIPLIVYDPDGAADGTRGTVDNRFAEAIDVVPTILDAVGLEVPDNIVEGRSLVPLLRGEDPDDWRDAVFSELDYAFYSDVRDPLERPIDQCRTFMVREGRWKYIAYEGYRAQLFDLEADPEELQDLGDDPAHEAERVRLHRRLADWQSGLKYRVTAPESFVREFKVKEGKSGVLIGNW